MYVRMTITYFMLCLCLRHRSGQLINELIVGAVDRLNVYLMYGNDGENAYNSYIRFNLPRQYFQHHEVFPSSVSYATIPLC